MSGASASSSTPAATASVLLPKGLPNASAWDACADKYSVVAVDVTGTHAQWVLQQVLEQAAKDGKRELKLLDVACGSGAVSIAAAQRTDIVADVLASDFSPAMCKVVEKRYAALSAGDKPRATLRTLVSDACDLKDIATASVDVAFCIFGIMLLPDPDAAARELVRVVRPGGLVGFATWMPQQSQLHGVIMKVMKAIGAANAAAAGATAPTEQKPAAEAPAPTPAPASAPASASTPASVNPGSQVSHSDHGAVSKMIHALPYSVASQFEALFSSLALESVFIGPHDETSSVHPSARAWWTSVEGTAPSFQPSQQGPDIAEKILGDLWGPHTPFALTATSLVAIGRKPQA